ncbi:MAG TPA: hypothetical protein VF681_10095 [Abditibacteriaceae bacterium]
MEHTFSSDQSKVFASVSREKPWRIGETWIDLYQLLGVAENAHPREIGEAITNRSAEILQFSFARAGHSDFIHTLEKHLAEFRPILLDNANRARYNALLARHRAGEAEISYDEFVASLSLRANAQGCLSALLWIGFACAARVLWT